MANRRRYTESDIQNALAAVKANRGYVRPVAKKLGIPKATLQGWVDGKHRPEVQPKKTEELAAELEKLAWTLLDSTKDKIADAPLNHIMTSLGIAIDKARLLRDQPTAINKSEHSGGVAAYVARDPDAAKLAQQLAERLEFGALESGGVCLPGESGPLGDGPSSESTEPSPGGSDAGGSETANGVDATPAR